jgi:hypothetical protein
MKTKHLVNLLFLLFFLWLSGIAKAQDSIQIRESALKVFIDCDYCDLGNLRQELTFVNYVRDTKEADVHILVAVDYTGGGGSKYSFYFIGQGKYEGIDDTLYYATPPDATTEIIRQGQKQIFKLGLLRYIAKTPMFNDFSISYNKQSTAEVVEDKWKSWVYAVYLNGYLYGEESQKDISLYSTVTANKVTPDWKISFAISSSYYRQQYTYDSIEIASTSNSGSFHNSIVKSLNDHWSAGYVFVTYTSTYNNIEYAVVVSPAIEYDLFKYSESTRRQLCFLYKLGYAINNYIDTTVYLKTRENLFQQSLAITLQTKQKWGSTSVNLTGSNWLHDFSKNSVNINASLQLRIFKGLSFNLYGSVSLIHNQLSLAKGGASLEDILLRQKQLASQYNYYMSVGLSYTFGSIYNNIVNPRFDN